MMSAFWVLSALAMTPLTLASTQIQKAAEAHPRFDVASIRPSAPTVSGYSLHGIVPAAFTVTGMTVKEMIAYAYSLQNYQIVNRPKWMDTERFDIVAKDTAAELEHATSRQRDAELEDNYPRLQGLLAERFALKVHSEKREMPVLAVTVAARDKLKPMPCSPNGGYSLQTGLIKGVVAMRSLVALLAHDLDRNVVDQTGLTGCFDMDAKWTQSPDAQDDSAPAISTALAAAGLKLATVKGQVDFLVIDHVERPTPN